MTKTIFADFAQLWPERFTNITNGITPRRWLKQANPGLSRLITHAIGDPGSTTSSELERISRRWPRTRVPRASSAPSSARTSAGWRRGASPRRHRRGRPGLAVRRAGQAHPRVQAAAAQLLCTWSRATTGCAPARRADAVPRTVIFAGKAAPGYVMAKLIIRLIHDVAESSTTTTSVDRAQLKVVFLPDYDVSLARADHARPPTSREQISTAGTRGLGHRQHEARAERRADDRHARRRQRRDPRGGRRRRTSSSSG